jgi:hypothetical protein
MEKTTPHCRRFDWQATALACFLTLWIAGIRIAISSAMMEITTKSSISVNALSDCFLALHLPARRPTGFGAVSPYIINPLSHI